MLSIFSKNWAMQLHQNLADPGIQHPSSFPPRAPLSLSLSLSVTVSTPHDHHHWRIFTSTEDALAPVEAEAEEVVEYVAVLEPVEVQLWGGGVEEDGAGHGATTR